MSLIILQDMSGLWRFFKTKNGRLWNRRQSQVLCLKPKAVKFSCREREKASHEQASFLLSLRHWLLVSLNRQCRVQLWEIYPFICCGYARMHPTTHHFYFILLVFHSAGWLNRIMSPTIIINQNYGLKNGGRGNCLPGRQTGTGPRKEVVW